MNALKNSLKNDNIENAFDLELKLLLDELNQEDVPANLQDFMKIIRMKIKPN